MSDRTPDELFAQHGLRNTEVLENYRETSGRDCQESKNYAFWDIPIETNGIERERDIIYSWTLQCFFTQSLYFVPIDCRQRGVWTVW